jgi:hypothetical protein
VAFRQQVAQQLAQQAQWVSLARLARQMAIQQLAFWQQLP